MKPTPKPVCRTLAAALALALALTAGCTIRPEPLSDDEHRARVAEDRKAIASEFVPVSAPLTLPEAIARALKYNYENRLALMESVLQDRQLSVANFAMLPRLAVNAGYSARDNDLASVSQDVYPERHPRENNYQTSNDRAHHFADLTFTWNLLDFGVGYYQARQQADRVLVARERRRKVVNNIVKEVTAAYWRAATAERLLPQVRPVLARAEQALRASRSIEQDQLQPLIPTLEYRRNLLQVVGQLRKLAADLEVSKAQLAGLINVPAGAPLPIAVPARSEALPGAMQASLEQLETVGLHYRPDLREEAYQARIDRLGDDAKRTLQTASVIGKEFSGAILSAVAVADERDALSSPRLAAALDALRAGEFVHETALYPEVEYAFKHPLTQEVAYRSQLGARRAQVHAAVARAIEQLHADKLDERAALLAYHWEQAGEALVAAQWYARSARVAGFDSPVEAVRHWEKVWEILAAAPPSDAGVTLRREAATQLLLFGWRLGMSGERVSEIFAAGNQLARAAGDVREQVCLHYSFALFHALDGDPRRGFPIFEAGVAMADATGEPELRSHGVIDAPLRAAVWDRGLRELVGPSALALAAAA